jgi:diguanylate cyclase (GGDEF)-like protein
VESGVISTGGQGAEGTQNAALDQYLANYCGEIQRYFSGVADYTHGVTSYYYCINPEISRQERGFFYRKVGKTGFIQQPPLEVEELERDEILGATWYEAAISRGCPAWVGPYYCEGEWVCSYFVPIYKSGILIGVMGMDIPCETLVEQVSGIHVYDSGYVCLLDEAGHVIYHPDLPIGSSLAELGMGEEKELLRRESSGEERISYTAGSEERQMSFSTLKNGMKLVSVAPVAEINAPWSRLTQTILLIAAAVVAFYAILIFFLMRAISRPLVRLTDASKRLANADYDVDLNYAGKNEIGTLTSSFKQMRDQIRHYIDDLNHQIYHDRLTDLPNMRHFFTLARGEQRSLRKEGRQSVMVYFDIIGLGHYNRQYGFDKGDRLIVDFAQILVRQFGKHRVCRFSGDQFMVMTDEASVERELQAVLRKCERAMDGERLNVRVGVYPTRLEDVDINVACDRAQFAGDQNKGELSSSVTYFDEEMLRKGNSYRHIMNNLDQALEEGWVKVYYQPIIRAVDGKVCDEEALARWIDPELGFLSPGSSSQLWRPPSSFTSWTSTSWSRCC